MRAEAGDRASVQPAGEIVWLEIERIRRQRLVGRFGGIEIMRLLPCAIIVLDGGEALGCGFVDQRIEQERRAGGVVEQCVRLVPEQRQPMFHAGVAAALADGLVKRVAARLRAKLRQVVLAEPADGFRGELDLAHRHQIERAELAGGALRFRIEGADALQRVAEEIEPHRRGHSRREKVENAAAHRIFAGVDDGGGALETVGLQPALQRVHVDAVAGRGGKALRRDFLQRRHALDQGVDGGAENARALDRRFGPREPRQHRDAARRDGGVGGNAVVGLAIPRRKFQRLDLRRGKSDRLAERAGALPVARDMDEDRRALLALDGERLRQLGGDEGIVAVGDGGEGQRAALGQFGNGAGEVGQGGL